ncbi:hypothetical protein DC083_09110 [Ignatzschineria ureiclastica]|uniref:Uncharacterized protein n=1 Tax=Ignatzschineria ureiclastica TaxID=472582 RepID=A0A2U2AD18_9GAMM|nr:SEL1-like repeat protein [Ignatzschineria ureiclastica]PWD80459.1 hypothetical protein DC083_09110 [Ignatzschineria ureiclastica]GGZ99340.1 hypothetical protein GCM10007162_14320 [Ignatzschineria ureiclastica]
MKKNALALTLSLIFTNASLTFADINKGLDAYLDNRLETSYQEFLQSANAGDSNAAYIVGMMLLTGELGTADPEAGQSWLITAMNQGSAPAAYNLALYYLNGTFKGDYTDFKAALDRAKSLQYADAFLIELTHPDQLESRYQRMLTLPEVIARVKELYAIDPSDKHQLLLGFLTLGTFINEPEEIAYSLFTTEDITQSINDLVALYHQGYQIAAMPLTEFYSADISKQIGLDPSLIADIESPSPEDLFFQMLEYQSELLSSPAPIFQSLGPEKITHILTTLRKAADQSGEASYRLAQIFQNGVFTGKKDDDKANEWFEKAIQLGDFRGMQSLIDHNRYNPEGLQRVIPYLLTAAEQNDPVSLGLLAKFYARDLYYAEEIPEDFAKAQDYLIKAATLGDFPSLTKLINLYAGIEYGYDYNIKEDLPKALEWAKRSITLNPSNPEAYFKIIRLWQDNDLLTQNYNLYEYYIQTLLQIAPLLPQTARAAAYFYELEGEKQNFTEALQYYDQALQDPEDEDYDDTLFLKARLLKKIAIASNKLSDNRLSDTALSDTAPSGQPQADLENDANAIAALQILLQLSARYEDVPKIAFELAEIYHYGIGTAINLDKAIEFYRNAGSRAEKPLGLLLLSQDSLESQNEGSLYLTHSLMLKEDADIHTALFAHPDLTNVQMWLYDIYQRQSLPESIEAFTLIEAGDQAKIPQQQLNYAKILKSIEPEKANEMLDKLVADNYEPAIREKLSQYSFFEDNTRQERIKLEKQLIAVATDNREAYQRDLIDDYHKMQDFQAAKAILQASEIDEDAWVRTQNEEGLALLAALEKGVQANDSEAIISLAEIYEAQQEETKATALLESAIQKGDTAAIIYQADRLLKSGRPEDLQKAKSLYLSAGEEQAPEVDEKLYQLYTQYPQSPLTEIEITQWLKANVTHYPNAQHFLDEITQFQQNLAIVNDPDRFNLLDQKAQIHHLKSLATAYDKGKGTPINPSSMQTYYEQAAMLGDGASAAELGYLFADTDLALAAHWFQISRHNNYYAGDRVLKQWEALQAAEQGDIEAQHHYFKEYTLQNRSYLEGNNELKALIRAGSIDANVTLAERLLYYPAFQDYYAQAISLLRTAIKAGNPDAATLYVDTLTKYQYAPDIEDIDAEIVKTLSSITQPITQKYLVQYSLYQGRDEAVLNLIPQLIEQEYRDQVIIQLIQRAVLGQNTISFAELQQLVSQYLTNAEKSNVEDSDLEFYLGLLSLKGDHSSTANEVKAIAHFQKSLPLSFEHANELISFDIAFDFESLFERFYPIGVNAIEGKEGFSHNQAALNFGLETLTQLAHYQSLAAGSYLVNYFSQIQDYYSALLYSVAFDFTDQIAQLQAILPTDKALDAILKGQALQASFAYRDYLPKLRQLEQSIAEGNDRALVALGDAYINGEIVLPNIDKAIAYYEEAGAKGVAFAYNRLGNLYRKADNKVPQDIHKALFYFDLGAKLNDSNCAHQAGDILYLEEAGITQDIPKALEYFAQTSVKEGRHHALAKYKMAEIYYKGLGGIPVDKAKAYELLKTYEAYDDHANNLISKALADWDFE